MNPQQHLEAAGSMYPAAWRQVDVFRQSRGIDLPKWPDWCFMPMAAWYSIVSADAGLNVLPPHLVGDVSRLAAIGTWRYSQGIYRFDPDVYSALRETAPSGEMPTAVLYRLPEWCVYIETPDTQWLGIELLGYWAHLEWDANTQRHELRLLLNTPDDLIPVPLHMGPWTITEAIDRAWGEAAKQAPKAGITFSPPPGAMESTAADVYGLVSLLLYLCSDEPEIDDEREPGTSPKRPESTRTKRGWKLFPAKKPRVWTVGKNTGEQLRSATAASSSDDKRKVTPHLRRAHWHGFWTGPRSGERKFNYKWLPPTFVRGTNDRS